MIISIRNWFLVLAATTLAACSTTSTKDDYGRLDVALPMIVSNDPTETLVQNKTQILSVTPGAEGTIRLKLPAYATDSNASIRLVACWTKVESSSGVFKITNTGTIASPLLDNSFSYFDGDESYTITKSWSDIDFKFDTAQVAAAGLGPKMFTIYAYGSAGTTPSKNTYYGASTYLLIP